jgi:dTMP kinase
MTTRPSPEEETRLFTEDRRDHVSQVIEPALANGVTVICDRYVLSSAAYQGARGLDPRAIMAENHSFARRPDVTFLLLIPVAEALDRIAASREDGFSLFEVRRDLEAVDAVYRSFIDQTVTTIDAAQPIEAIQEELICHLQSIPSVDRQESHSA